MNADQYEQQLAKYRRQERFNRILIKSVLGFFAAAVLLGVTLLLVKWLKGTPTLTPGELVREAKSRQGQVVRVKGRVEWISEGGLRLSEEDKERFSVLCHFPDPVEGIRVGDSITVQGTATRSSALVDCKIADD